MKEFLQILRRFVPPYKKYLGLSILFNILSAVLNIFSFAALIPILQILFQVDGGIRVNEYMHWNGDWGSIKEVATNNLYYYIQEFIVVHSASTALLVIGLFLAFMTFLKTGAYFLSSATIIPIRTGIVRDIRNQIYQKINSLSLGFFSEERKGDIIARMSGDVQEVESSIMSSLDMLFKNPILILFYFITLICISWQLTLFTILFVPPFGWFMGVVGKKLKAQSIEAQALWSDTMSMVEETLSGLRIIKAFCAEGKMNKRFDQVNSSYRDNIMRVNIRQQMAHPMSEFLGTILIVVVLWFGGILVLDYGRIDGPTIIFYLVMLYSIINPLKEFSKASYNIPKGLASMERIDKILQAEVEIKDKETPEHISSFEHQIEFRHVSFAYTDRKSAELVYVLKDINLVIPKGKTVALVGQSGSGKSTMVDLIPRYYDVQEGEVLIDGINVKDLAVHDLRMLIGNVNQEAILFNASFKDNIRFGKTDATDEEIANAAKIANAYEFITKSEKGFDTNIGDRGGRLSGGQRQRVSIARAILKNPPILILDEATSALDTESERLVQDALEKLMKTRTTVAVAHRLSTIKHADEICVLHEGRIVERGTHEELIEKKGYYKKLHDMQQV
ncbi:ABC transporter ATP-binding protein [Segatella copri]|uniref:ABC transporter ATP-binding protein n=1 Tax=Segatella copri TaxID=165179 RepID=UPI00129248BD|nr:ABC transporter ATP-binding protein [Segatella copri]MQM89831.1 ABC transporter ATP-binding protein [Segatella copri]MQM95160.1 ABC transporter ATP-binding protein [Segatella copri]MQN05225.1 ABC transporter ATP-binding protein [Segatella copri]MQN16542.1 ABC transporter ATP-binding protein [Segatella copri]MQN20376.1 ABC transporter ATP-binding protein [Segatella copri]